MASSNEVTLSFGYCWEYTKMGLNSGFGTIMIRTAPWRSRTELEIELSVVRLVLQFLATLLNARGSKYPIFQDSDPKRH